MSGLSVGGQRVVDNGTTNRTNVKAPVNNAPSLESVQGNGSVLSRGMIGESVTQIQNGLKTLGYKVEPTATFDQATVNAVKKFQADHGIKQTGNVGELTLNRLFKFAPDFDKVQLSDATRAPKATLEPNVISFVGKTPSTPVSRPTPKPQVEQAPAAPVNNSPTLDLVARGKAALKKGMSGESVLALQQKLKNSGYEDVPLTGVFDDKTEEVLKNFQKESAIKQTGHLEKVTLDALNEYTQDESYSVAITDAANIQIQDRRSASSTPGTPPSNTVSGIGSSETTDAGLALAKKAKEVALRMQPHRNPKKGKCYHGVKLAVKAATGIELYGTEAYQAAGQLAKNSKFKEVKVSSSQLDDLPPGAIVVWGKTSRSPHGHISVSLGNGKEASDHVSNQLEALRGASNFRVFIPQ